MAVSLEQSKWAPVGVQGETLGLRKRSLVKGSWGDFPVGGIEAGNGEKRGSAGRGGEGRTSEDSKWVREK